MAPFDDWVQKNFYLASDIRHHGDVPSKVYYDLSQAGVPVHSTAFRPIDELRSRNPFRMFTSLLRTGS